MFLLYFRSISLGIARCSACVPEVIVDQLPCPPYSTSAVGNKMSYLQTSAVSHARRVRSLYKEATRQLQSLYGFQRHIFRYHAVVLRARFDENKDVIDMRVAKKLLIDGEQELFLNQHPQPVKFPLSPGGVAYNREPHAPDWMLDVWHPYEKAQYPEYFARREIRKREFIERWEKKYGKADPDAAH